MFGLSGKITAHAGHRDALVDCLVRASRVVGALEGCYLYLVSVSPTESDAVWVMEVWRSAHDHQASLALGEIRAIIDEARPLIAGMSESSQFIPVGGHGLPARLFPPSD